MFDKTPYNAFLDLDLTDRVIGGYRIESELGRGGFGRVFKVVRETDGAVAALKILNPGLTQIPEIAIRFRREATLASRLEHPNIVRIYDFGPWEDTFYFAMQFIEGQTLWNLVWAEGPLPLDKALDYIAQSNAALSRACELGVVHRDIKPGNILIDPAGHVFLLDFGLAKEIAATAITRPGAYLGTLEYMAPEQLAGQPADIRSDLYSLGLVFWQCLTGTVPYGKRDISELLESRRVNVAPRVVELRKDVPVGVVAILHRLLEFYPSARYPSPAALADDLQRVRAGLDIAHPPPIASATIPVSVTPEELERIRSGQIIEVKPDTPGDSENVPPTEPFPPTR